MGQDATFVVIPLSFASDASDAFRSSVRAHRSLSWLGGFGDGDVGHAGEGPAFTLAALDPRGDRDCSRSVLGM
jgi:hypothetical protein